MQPQEQPVPAPQPVYYVPVHAAPAPPPAPPAGQPVVRPDWAQTLLDRTSGHSVALGFLALMLLGNLIMTFVLWSRFG